MATTGVHARRCLRDKKWKYNSASGLGDLKMARVIYDYAVDGGAATAITPLQNVLLPDNSVIIGGVINSTSAVTSSGGANVSVGTSAGSSATAILGSTAKASLSLDAILAATPTIAVPVKLTDKGRVTITPDAILTAGVIEIVLFYFVANG